MTNSNFILNRFVYNYNFHHTTHNKNILCRLRKRNAFVNVRAPKTEKLEKSKIDKKRFSDTEVKSHLERACGRGYYAICADEPPRANYSQCRKNDNLFCSGPLSVAHHKKRDTENAMYDDASFLLVRALFSITDQFKHQ